VRPIFDVNEWRKNQEEIFIARLDALIAAAARLEPSPSSARRPARSCRFYMSRGMYPEAKGVTRSHAGRDQAGLEDPAALIVHSVASILIGRPEQGLKDLANPAIGTNYDSQLWKALAFRASGQMGGCAREIQERRIRHHLAAAGAAAHRDYGCDAGLARGQGLFRSRAARSDLDVIGIPPR
jgi:hypothetical protein